MVKSITGKLFSISRKTFFEKISPKYKTAPFKNMMDYLYVLFEKIGCKIDIVVKYYLEMYDEIIEKEINMAKISKEQQILIIGSGSIPATPLLISQKTKAKIVALDCDLNAVKNSSNLLKNKYPSQNIEIQLSDGKEYTMKNFDYIFVLYGVKKQKETLKKIYQKINKETQAILRSP